MLSIDMMGLEMPNPVMVSAGPWSRGHELIRKALQSGAGAVVTESIVSEPYPDVCPRYAYANGGMQNIRVYSGINLDKWLEELAIIKESKKFGHKGLIIANIMASSPSELGYLAKKMEQAGVDAIELGLASPIGEGTEIIAGNEKETYEFTKAAVRAAGIPVMVKLSHNTSDLSRTVKAVERAGACGISAIDTMRCILNVDVETGIPVLPTYGGYSGAPIRPMGLAAVAWIAQSTKLPIVGIGGIENHINLLEYIMLGASAGAAGTSVLLNGYERIRSITENLEGWLKSHHIDSISEIRGRSLRELKSYEEIIVEPKVAVADKACSDSDCLSCVKCCISEAIQLDGNNIAIDSSRCNGCGLCAQVCPHDKIRLKYK